ncbi:MAG: sulfite exporter TauE/SafE family protein [Cyclobacteriaceae bacterium]
MIFDSSIISQLEWHDWLLACVGALILGLAKGGIKGIGILIVVIMAYVFDARPSTGIVIPMLIVGDIFAVIYYNRHAQWSYLFRFLPWMIVGVLCGVWFGNSISEEMFRNGMAVLVFLSVGVMFYWDLAKMKVIPKHWTFAGSMGLMAGFTTMIGNLAGGFSNLFFLAMRLPKNNFIGTAAWLYFIVNLVKLPFHIFVWKTVTLATLQVNLYLLPLIIVGLFAGVRIVKLIDEGPFRKIILVLTALGAIFILFR